MTERHERRLRAEEGPALFQPLRLRGLEVPNRLWLSAMCQYSAVDGIVGDWHLAHLGDRASGGWGLLVTESTAVSPEGRITAGDAGIWNDAQANAWSRVVDSVHGRGSRIALQLGHAGRKSSLPPPWSAGGGTVAVADGGWVGISATAEPASGLAPPRAASGSDLREVVRAFGDAARRGAEAGFDAIELLAGHGFLIHSFLSALTNDRSDEYGVRTRLLEEIVTEVRGVLPAGLPLLVRISARDWIDGGITDDEAVATAALLRERGVDLIDVSTGGLLPAGIPVAPGYQVASASAVRRGAHVAAGAVGLITSAAQAERIIASGDADVVLIGRAGLRDPYFPLRAAHELGAVVEWQPQYLRAAWG